MLAKQIGANIKAARKAKGWSLEKLAAKVEPKSSYQHMSRLEKGGPALDIEWIERIARALGVDPLSLVAPDQPKTQGFTLDEQVANEVARTLAEVALRGEEPETGTVQAIALILTRLTETFSEHPQTAADVQAALPLLNLASKLYVPARN
jgi:transcriptional regulator with XRE-family HTH domain